MGGLDEDYIYGLEDVDFSLKLHKNGYKTLLASNALLFFIMNQVLELKLKIMQIMINIITMYFGLNGEIIFLKTYF